MNQISSTIYIIKDLKIYEFCNDYLEMSGSRTCLFLEKIVIFFATVILSKRFKLNLKRIININSNKYDIIISLLSAFPMNYNE